MQNINADDVLTLVRLVAWSYPILSHICQRPCKPFALILDDASDVDYVCRSIAGPVGRIMDFRSFTKLSEIVDETCIWPIVFSGSNRDNVSSSEQKRLNEMVALSQADGIENIKLQTAVVGLFIKHIPYDFEDDFFKIDLRGAFDNKLVLSNAIGINLSGKEALLNLRDVEEIRRENEDSNQVLSMFKCSIGIATRVFPELDCDKLKKVASQLCIWDDEADNTSDIGCLFIDQLYKSARKQLFKHHGTLPNVETELIDKLDETVFEDNNYVYISEELFSKIVEGIRDIFPIGLIKDRLSDENIIVRDKGTYTSKMHYATPMGQDRRKRMIRLNKNRINKAGEMEFCVFCRPSNMPESGDDHE